MIHMFTGGLSSMRQNEAPNIRKDPSPLSVFKLFFLEMMQLLVQILGLPPILGHT
jgi:hypothetical protein